MRTVRIVDDPTVNPLTGWANPYAGVDPEIIEWASGLKVGHNPDPRLRSHRTWKPPLPTPTYDDIMRSPLPEGCVCFDYSTSDSSVLVLYRDALDRLRVIDEFSVANKDVMTTAVIVPRPWDNRRLALDLLTRFADVDPRKFRREYMGEFIP